MGKLNVQSAALESAPSNSLRAVAPSDTVALPNGVCRAVYVGAGGTLRVMAENDAATVDLVGVGAGQIVPVRCSMIYATGTTATSIVALY